MAVGDRDPLAILLYASQYVRLWEGHLPGHLSMPRSEGSRMTWSGTLPDTPSRKPLFPPPLPTPTLIQPGEASLEAVYRLQTHHPPWASKPGRKEVGPVKPGCCGNLFTSQASLGWRCKWLFPESPARAQNGDHPAGCQFQSGKSNLCPPLRELCQSPRPSRVPILELTGLRSPLPLHQHSTLRVKWPLCRST